MKLMISVNDDDDEIDPISYFFPEAEILLERN